MTTPVWFTVCKVPANINGTTLGAECNIADRMLIQTTVEQLTTATGTASEPFDYAYASAIWSLAFTTVVGLYLVSKNVGLILALIRGR